MAASLDTSAYRNQTFPWFTDIDDGTLIHLELGFESGGSGVFSFVQNTEPETCGVDDTLGAEKDAPVLSPFPADFESASGGFSRFDDRISLFLEELTPSRINTEDTYSINKNYITRYDFKNVESVGTSNGNANQIFTAGSVIILPTLGTPTIFVGGISSGTKFRLTADLSSETASAKVFEYDSSDGTITFGDGTNGAIPENGKEIVLRISVRNGGGTWEFVEIVVPAEDKKNIGVVKSIKDKVFYSKSDIALIDASKFTNVHSKINVIEQTITLEGTPLQTVRFWSLTMGGEVTATGGDVITQNTSATAYANRTLPRTGTPVRHNGIGVPGGDPASIFNKNNHVPLDVDIGSPYPSTKATAPTEGQSKVVDPETDLPTVVEATVLNSGAIASPDRYAVGVDVLPIFEVWEIITHNTFELQSPQRTGQPCAIVFTPAPAYSLFWFSWPDVYFGGFGGLAIEQCLFPAQNRINGYGISCTSSSSQRPRVGGIDPKRGVTRMIEMADIVGDFDNPVRTGSGVTGGVGTFPFGFNVGSDPTTISTGTFDSPGAEPRHIVYGDGCYGTQVNGDKTQRPQDIFMKWETRSVAENQETEDVFGGPLFPNFQTTFDVEEGNVVTLEDVKLVAPEIFVDGVCVNHVDPFSTTGDFDARISVARSRALEATTAGATPFLNTF